MISCFLNFKDVSQNSLEHWNDVSGAESAEHYDDLSEKRRSAPLSASECQRFY